MWPRKYYFGVVVLAFFSFLVGSFASSATTAMEERSAGIFPGTGDGGLVQMEGSPPGVVWVVQMSDIHISKWVPARGEALRRSLGRALKLIKPAIVLVTGDLTGAVSHTFVLNAMISFDDHFL